MWPNVGRHFGPRRREGHGRIWRRVTRPTLQIADNGGGIYTAIVKKSARGSLNTIFVGADGISWSKAGDIIGNGNIRISPATGLNVAFVASVWGGQSAASEPVKFTI
jgi:hypothetical protein